MLGGIWIVLRKELVYTLRDRKTLAFMLLIPTLAIPLIMFGFSRLVERMEKRRAVKVLRVAADTETRQAYRQLVYEWFLGTDVAAGVRLATSPIMQALVKPEQAGALGELRPEVLTDPAAFEEWTRAMVTMVREGLDAPEQRTKGPMIKLPEEVQEQIVAYYQVVIKGFGLIEFVDPATLPDAPEDFQPPALPEQLRSLPHARALAWGIKAGAIEGYLEIPAGVKTLEHEDQRALEITFLHDSTNSLSAEADARITLVVAEACRCWAQKRLKSRGLTEAFIEPLAMKRGTDLATRSERTLAQIGGFLPYIVILFTFLGAMYPAIDLGAGEKERFTLETLLLSPLSRTELAFGKSLVILITALITAFLSLLSLALSVKYLVPERLLQVLDVHIDPGTAVAAALLTIPPAVSFTGVLLALSIYARSFKEAQNYMTALMYVIVLAPMAGLLPGLELDWKLALIPLVNVSLLARDFLKGSTNWGYYAATLGSCLALAGICLAYAVRQFKREEVLFRS
jgi:sodium transport system permease protein